MQGLAPAPTIGPTPRFLWPSGLGLRTFSARRVRPDRLAALAAGDREKLYQAALPRFKTLQGENPFFVN